MKVTCHLRKRYLVHAIGLWLARHQINTLGKKWIKFPSGQYLDKNNCTLRVADGKERERTGKPLKSLGGCNFRKGNYLRFCRESVSQCGGQGFDPPLLHQ